MASIVAGAHHFGDQLVGPNTPRRRGTQDRRAGRGLPPIMAVPVQLPGMTSVAASKYQKIRTRLSHTWAVAGGVTEVIIYYNTTMAHVGIRLTPDGFFEVLPGKSMGVQSGRAGARRNGVGPGTMHSMVGGRNPTR